MKTYNAIHKNNWKDFFINDDLRVGTLKNENGEVIVCLMLLEEVIGAADASDITFFLSNNEKDLFYEIAYEDEDGVYDIDPRHYEDMNWKLASNAEIIVEMYLEELNN